MPAADAPSRKPRLQRIASAALAAAGVRFYDLYYGEKNLLAPIQVIQPPIELTIRRAGDDDVRRLFAMLSGDAARLRRCRDDLAMGSTCTVALHGDEIAGYSWAHRTKIILMHHCVANLPPHGGYTYGSYVFPPFRGKKVFQCMTRAVFDDLKAQGCQFAANLVDRHNAGSIGARRYFAVRYQPARILTLPCVGAIILGRRFVMGATLGDAGSVAFVQPQRLGQQQSR